MNTDHLRVGGPPQDFPVSRLSGPGLRWIVWLQGCSLRCTRQCLNPELLDPAGGVDVSPEAMGVVLDGLTAKHADLEGVTLLGGEPFDQATVLAPLAADIRRRGLSVMTYTGWVFEDLLERGPAGSRELLAATDLLLDGPFVPERHSTNLLWCGSDNQRLLLLSDRYRREDLQNRVIAKGIDARFDGRHVQITGAQDRTLLQDILSSLRSHGFSVQAEAARGGE